MLNAGQRQASTPAVVAKGKLENRKTKGYHLQNKQIKIINTYLKRLTHTTDG